jgi:hypothetical protein
MKIRGIRGVFLRFVTIYFFGSDAHDLSVPDA